MQNKIIGFLGFMGLVLGGGGVAGALENESNVLIPIVIFIVGIVATFSYCKREGLYEENHNNRYSHNVGRSNSRPYYLR